MKYIYLLLSIILSGPAFSQTELFKHYTLNDSKLKSFQIHLITSDSTATKPLLVYLDGSGNFPIYFKAKSGKYSTSVPIDLKKYSKDYHIVLISKPSTPFKDSLQTNASGKRFYPTNESYTALYSLDWRAETASKAINFLIKKIPVNKKKIVVMGYSEGSQVAPRVAVLNKKVTNVVCIVGNALNHFYDFLINTRLDVEQNRISPMEGQKIIDSLYNEYEKIYADPLSTKKTWYGETYLKWSSFTKTTPLENMLKLNIPILYIAGGKDNNQTIIGMDYAKLEFIRQGKKNLTYKVYPNSNHYFQEEETKDGKIVNVDRIDEVHQFAIDWLNGNTIYPKNN
ncbi:bile acid acyltransferase/acyl-CoA thioester hydrolase-like protein [Chryseobacterium sp. 52]|uniref:acyl-CoA thioester hydrolase/BAAT C-terminal domain-containing protein n=1 Tax=Chryseobacterium sp. 52 TaxID=2035213 RepID=UPI000C19EC79|nr:acyl-CoA thioester hydrolase/BAAT C-terminal domain-containing protein [Chryseobacterium sp. 52]PIF45868.1 bile acid acyltransferase/acyl-CoA thioester hydrolase-like protein [Chryseobacterium sp. 52]